MTKFFFFLSVLISLFFETQAQEFSHEFGKISQTEIDMKEYDKDKSAEAVVIYDIGKAHLIKTGIDTFETEFKREKRIKIFTEAGIKFSIIEIPYEDDFTVIDEIKACTYNLETGIIITTKLDSSNIFEENDGGNSKIKKFAMPNVKPGSIIEYSYTSHSRFSPSFSWNFQSQIPTIYSEYELKTLQNFKYTWLLQGATKFDYQNSYVDDESDYEYYPDMINKFVMQNVPAFKDEECLKTIQDYVVKVIFQLSSVYSYDGWETKIITTWKSFNKLLLNEKDFGKFIGKAKENAKTLFNVDSVKTLPEKSRFDFTVNFVKHNFRYNHRTGFDTQTFEELIKNKIGCDADLNLLLTGFLKAVRIETYPVILSTRPHGKVRVNYPFEQSFDYVISLSKIDGIFFFGDATEQNLPPDRISPKCINDNALLVKKGRKITWIDLNTSVMTSERIAVKIIFTDNVSSFQTDFKNTSTEYEALSNRNNYGNADEKLFDYLTKKYQVEKKSISIKNAENPNLPYIYSFSATDSPEEINEKIYVSPFLKEPISENPLKQATRIFPVDMNYPSGKEYFSTILIPKGYKVDFVPENYTFKNELFEMKYNVSVDEDKINVSCIYAFFDSVYPAADYENIKSFFSQIVKKSNEKVVFSKI